MAVQRSASAPGQFRAGVAAAQIGYGGRARDSFYSAHSQQHDDTRDQMSDHEGRLAALEQLNPTTMDASTGKLKPPGPQNYEED